MSKRNNLKTKKPTEGIYRKLSKLRSLMNDDRLKDGRLAEAKRLFAKMCSNYGIDPACIREDGYNFSNQVVLEIQTDSRTFDSFLRVVCLLVGEYWGCQIRGRAHLRGNCVLDFVTEKPQRPDEAARSYRLIKEQLDIGWNRAQQAWKQEEAKLQERPTIAFFVGGLGGRPRPPHKKSYVSGFYHAMKERLAQEQACRRLHRRYLEEPEPVAPVALLPEPEPWVPPPPNPLALAVIIKDVWCCPDAILPNIRCPKCLEFDRYASRKVSAERRKLQKVQPPPEPEPQDAGPSDDPEYEAQHDDACDTQSYMAGQSAASRLDLNLLKL